MLSSMHVPFFEREHGWFLIVWICIVIGVYSMAKIDVFFFSFSLKYVYTNAMRVYILFLLENGNLKWIGKKLLI